MITAAISASTTSTVSSSTQPLTTDGSTTVLPRSTGRVRDGELAVTLSDGVGDASGVSDGLAPGLPVSVPDGVSLVVALCVGVAHCVGVKLCVGVALCVGESLGDSVAGAL